MSVLDGLTRYERWLCEFAADAESRGPWVARALPALEAALAGLVIAVSIANLDPARPLLGGLAIALGGVFVGRALPDLLWPRQQRLLALLYRGCLAQGGGGQSPSGR